MCENTKEVAGVGDGLVSVKSKRTRMSCLVCDRFITDPSTKAKGQDSAFCDGECKGWLHRVCVGLTKLQFSNIISSPKPFYCQHCSQFRFEEEITHLKSTIDILTERVKHLESINFPHAQPSFADVVRMQDLDISKSK